LPSLRASGGLLVAFEGPEGAGKSTQLELAATRLCSDGCDVYTTAEPGGTSLGREIRRLVMHELAAPPVAEAELCLYLADRAQHVAEVIRPALQAGKIVLVDRFSASTLAYQGYGRGLDLELVTRFEAWARGGLQPDLNLLLDCPVRDGLARARGNDRFHTELEAFHERVRQGFLALAAASPTKWVVIDSTGTKEEVHFQVMDGIRRTISAPASGQ
jgi:dTMP kinase